jgi:hypothetical protein
MQNVVIFLYIRVIGAVRILFKKYTQELEINSVILGVLEYQG